MTEREINPEEELAKEFIKKYFSFDDSWLAENHSDLIEKEKKGYLMTIKNCRLQEAGFTQPPTFENTNNFWNYFKQQTINSLRNKLAAVQEEIELYGEEYDDDRLRLDPYYGQTLYFWLKEGELILAFEKLGVARSQQMIEDINFCENSKSPASTDSKSRTTRYENSLRELAIIMHDDLEVPFGLIYG